MKKEKIIILFTVLIDVLGLSIVIPILPFYVTDFGASPNTVTILFSVYSLFSFFSNPFLGSLSDKIGRRPILLISILSSAIGWFVFASANSILFLFVGRIIDGIAAGNFSTAQSYLVDISKDEKERAMNLGLIGAVFGIGFMIGPILGGLLSVVSHSFPFWCAGFLSVANFIFAFYNLPETNHNRSTEKIRFNPLLPLKRAILPSSIRPQYISYFLFIFSWAGAQSIFSLYGHAKFNFSGIQIGLMFASLGLTALLNQVYLLKRFWLKNFSDLKLEVIMFSMMTIGSFVMASDSLILFFISFVPIATAQAILRVAITNQSAGKSLPQEKGMVIGTLSGIMSFAMIISPLIVGAMFEINLKFPFYFSGVLTLLAAFLSYNELKKSHAIRF